MWFRDFEDQQNDSYFKNEHVAQESKAITGCEMRERLGWGEAQQERNQLRKARQPGVLSMIAGWLLGSNLKRR